jgi:signal peptidase II
MRPLLESASGSGLERRPPIAVPALRGRGGVGIGEQGGPMNRPNLLPLGLIAGLIVLAADQLAKWWVLNVLGLPELRQVVLLPVLNLTMVWNQGVTFGLLNGLGTWGHAVLAVVAVCVVIALGFWLRRAENKLVAGAIGAIAGGAIGNVIDRVRFGAVVDFIHAHVETPWGNFSWYVFNLADAAIVCGVAVLIFEAQFSKRRQKQSA